MARYSIEDTTLTAIGDAVREKTGKLTKTITVQEEQVVPSVEVSKSMNATGFDTHDGQTDFEYFWDVISFPKATKIKVKIAYELYNPSHTLQIGIGEAHSSNEFNALSNITTYQSPSLFGITYQEDIYDSNIITIYFLANASFNMLGYYAECYPLDAEGNLMGDSTIIVDVEKVVTNTMTPLQMVSEIEAIDLGVEIPEEAFRLTGDCRYKFSGGNWDWFVNAYGDKITTDNITNCTYMFSKSSLETIPFDINGNNSGTVFFDYIFDNCKNLTSIPKITGRVYASNHMFYYCEKLREISEEALASLDWSYVESQTSAYNGNRNNLFQYCRSLRKIPMSFLAHGNPLSTNSYSLYYYTFSQCSSLDEIIGLPVVHRNASWASNAFYNTFQYCFRLKDITFETNEDGSPIVVDNWTKQTIDLTYAVGCVLSNGADPIYNLNSGITKDKEVTDDATYQALKEDPDWWTKDANYSRYNHDSAVRTINSLPDLSAKGGNTIKFRGNSGALTDGGAISNLTAEEIAVATAKGWTVTIS